MDDQQKKIAAVVLAAAALGLGAYAYSQENKNGGGADTKETKDPEAGTGTKPPTEKADFPLSAGSRGQYVRDIQLALLAMGGAAAKFIQDSKGADGNFGAGVASALKAAGYPASISKADYERILKDAKQSPEAKLSTGVTLKDAHDQVMYFEKGLVSSAFEAKKILTLIANVDDYKRLSSLIQKASWSKGKSLATLLTEKKYVSPATQGQLAERLKKIGLKQNASGLWMLPSLGLGTLAMAVGEGRGIASDGHEINFPARSIAGNHLRTRNGVAYIANSGRVYAVPSHLIARIPE